MLVSTAVLATVVATITAALLLIIAASEKFRHAGNLLGFAVAATFGVTGAATATFLLTPRWWVTTWLVTASLAAWSAIRRLTRTYPRRASTRLARERLRTVLGPDWTGQVVLTFDHNNRAQTATTTLPAKLIPSDITPRVRTVLGETLSGTWTTSTRGTELRSTRKIVENDPPILKNLKGIVLGPKAFTERSKVKILATNSDNGNVTKFIVRYDADLAADLAVGQRRSRIETLVRESLPADDGGAWVFDFDIKARTCEVRLSVFKSKVYHRAQPHQRATTRAEAIANYPKLTIPLGLDEFGNSIDWKVVGAAKPHGVIYGATGSGKSSQLFDIVASWAEAGGCVIIADFKCDTEYNGWRDWPNVHLVAQDTYSCLRAILYVEELMEQRRSGGRGPKHAPAEDVPILFVVDEFPTFVQHLTKTVWPEFRNSDDSLPPVPPPITSFGALLRLGRSKHIHCLSAAQRATKEFFDTEFKHNSPLKLQVGWADGVTSQNFWDNFEVGGSIPDGIPGRSLIKTPTGFVQYQGFFTPDPATATSERDVACLQALRPASRLYERALFDMPDANSIDKWRQIATAPLVSASSRPDLDPLSPKYNTARSVRRDTISKIIDAGSMQFLTDK